MAEVRQVTNTQQDKILIMGPSWVGDMVLAQSLFKILKQQKPDCIIEVAAPGWTLPLLERMPEVDAAIPLPFKHGQLALRERIRFGRRLKDRHYTQSIMLTNSLKSAILPAASGIKRRTGFLGEMRYGLLNDIRPLDKTRLPRTVDRFVALGVNPDAAIPSAIPNPTLVASKENALACLTKMDIDVPQAPVLGLCPGAEYGEAKRWPIAYYAEVARAAYAHGWQVWLFGSEKDVPFTAEINQLSNMVCLDLGGRTKLGDAIDLMSLCTAVVSNDSGLMHVAAALDKKLIAIYGSSDPHHTPPMSSKAVIEYLGLECSPCFQRECPLGHLNCLKQISPKHIIHTLTLN
ncbi:lipopolysaccharide heptosyltransferase II [Methylobacillus flagellatus]|uniref:lipopolysaccharide heptosyltransferase II n=1 Tax=Methylobacillus flagellatus (strain ATCC 51484 / DSM 6875 / VKM B-1610 / KT) TaxID=265072 RepID=Q1H3A1_METFK|nr:lipopolysaccharide heptosyltransferase II [Methylobacillus flagellatus]ABE49036.1 Lipopolysaccharide heptosyltransferase II [Methylobacillus flagellatus KT]